MSTNPYYEQYPPLYGDYDVQPARWSLLTQLFSPALVGKTGILGLAAGVYGFTVMATGATEVWKAASYVAYAFGAVLCIACLLPAYFGVQFSQIKMEFAAVAILLLSVVISTVSTLLGAWIVAWYLAQVYLLFCGVLVVCDSFRRFKLLMNFAFLGALLVAALGIMGIGGDSSASGIRDMGITRQTNAYGFVITNGIYCSFLLFHLSTKKTRLLIIGSWFVFLAAMAASGSRQAILATGAMVGMYGLLEWAGRLRRNMKPLIIGIILVTVFAVVLFTFFDDSALVQRLLSTNVKSDSRTGLYKIAWGLFLEHPLVGVGPGGFMFYSGVVYTHSSYMELLATTGIFSFLAYIGLNWLILYKAFYARHQYRHNAPARQLFSAMIAVVSGLAVGGLFHLGFNSKMDTFILACVAGVVIATCRISRNTSNL